MTASVSTGAQLVAVTFTGATAAGAVSVPGLQAGDVVVNGTYLGGSVTVPANWSPFSINYESAVSVVDQIQQIADLDWSSITFTVYLLRGTN